MSLRGGDGDEMRALRPGLDDEVIEQVLAGKRPDEEDLTTLDDFVAAVRTHVANTSPRPSADLTTVLSEGLATAPDARGAPGPAASDVGGSRQPKWTRRRRMILETVLAKVAALGLTAKVGVAAAAVAAGTTGAGAAGALPGPVQDTVARTVAAVSPLELPSSADDEAEPAGPQNDTVDAEGDDEFGARVADDATGEDGEDGEYGVDGSEIADEASDGRSSDLPDEAEEGRRTAEDNREEARANADEAEDNAESGRTEARNAPDEAEDRIPQGTPADRGPDPDARASDAGRTPDGDRPDSSASDAPADRGNGQDTAESAPPVDTPADAGPDTAGFGGAARG